MTLLEKSTSIKANSYFARARARERARAPDYGFQINLIAGAGEVWIGLNCSLEFLDVLLSIDVIRLVHDVQVPSNDSRMAFER